LFEKISDEDIPKVFLLDSLDVLASGRMKELHEWLFWVERLKYLQQTTVVCACRNFEAEHLYPLNNQEWSEKHLLSLPPIDWVINVLNSIEFNVNHLSKSFFEFLRTPLHLKIAVEIVEKGGDPSNILSIQELYTKLIEVLKVSDQNFRDMVYFAKKMVQNRSIQLSIATAGTTGIEKIHSVAKTGLVIFENNKIYFSHQTLLDYFYAWEIIRNQRSFKDFIIENNQNLFIRPIVRHILAFLRNEPKRLIKELESIFFKNDSDEKSYLKSYNKPLKIRMHIKTAILSSFASWPDPKPIEATFLLRIFDESKDGNIMMIQFFNLTPQKEWFKELRDRFILPSLKSPNSDTKRRIVFNYLAQNAKYYPEDVLGICLELINRGPTNDLEWFFITLSDIIYSQEMPSSVKILFEKFLEESLEAGIYSDIYNIQILCNRLAKLNPERALKLFLDSLLLDLEKIRIKRPRYSDTLVYSFFEIVPEIFKYEPNLVLNSLIGLFDKIFSKSKKESRLLDYPPLNLYGEFERRFGIKGVYDWFKNTVIGYCKELTDSSKNIISGLNKSKWKTQNHLGMLCMIQHPEFYSDEIISYLKSILRSIAQNKADYSDSELFIRVLEKSFGHLKDNERKKVIKTIISFRFEDDASTNLWIRRPLHHISYNFLDPSAQNKIKKLDIKYGKYKYSPPIKFSAFAQVKSPIKFEDLKSMNIDDLFEFLVKKRDLKSGWDTETDGIKGGVEELAQEVSRLFVTDIKKYRTIIENLARDNCNNIYLKWFFIQISNNKFSEKISKSTIKWIINLIYTIWNREEIQFEIVLFCSQVAPNISRIEYKKLKSILIRIAIENPDPIKDEFFKARESGYANDAIGEGINSTRGVLCEVFIKLITIFYDEEIFNTLKILANDKTISVRAALIFYLPMGLKDLGWEKCFELFRIAFRKGPEEYAEPIATFLQYVPKKYFNEVDEILTEMVQIKSKTLNKSYAILITVFYFRKLINEDRLMEIFTPKKFDIEAQNEAMRIIANQTKFEAHKLKALRLIKKIYFINKHIFSDNVYIIFLEAKAKDFKKLEPIIKIIIDDKNLRGRHVYYILEYLEKCLLIDAEGVFRILEKILSKSGKDFYDYKNYMPASHSKAPLNIINTILECYLNLEERALESLDKLIELRWQGVDDYLRAVDRL